MFKIKALVSKAVMSASREEFVLRKSPKISLTLTASGTKTQRQKVPYGVRPAKDKTIILFHTEVIPAILNNILLINLN